MLVEKGISTKRQNFLLAILVILVLLTLFIISRSIHLPKIPKGVSKETKPKKPEYLLQPIPSLKNIEKALENPKIKEIQYISPAQPTTPPTSGETPKKIKLPPEVGPIGRPNPFIPF